MTKARVREIRRLIEEHRDTARVRTIRDVASLEILALLVLPEVLDKLERLGGVDG